jgi:putative proteasome-type protease
LYARSRQADIPSGRVAATSKSGAGPVGKWRISRITSKSGFASRERQRMTYCIGALLKDGIVLASDSRTHAGVDNFAKFCKMTVFERAGDRVLILLSSGNLAGTQAVISLLKQRSEATDKGPTLWTARTMFDVVLLVSDAVRDIERRDAPFLEGDGISFNASFIVGGQLKGEPPRLFRTYAEGNFIEAGDDTQFLQTGEAKYGKPIVDRVLTPTTTLADATKCILVSFDSTMRSNLSVGMPIDLVCYERDSLEIRKRRRFNEGDAYFTALSADWSEGVRKVFRELPDLEWEVGRSSEKPGRV